MSMFTTSLVKSDDNHNGYYYVPASTTVTVTEYKQMTCFGPLENDGEIHIEGMLVLEE